jgi:hypothetical protein
VSFARRWAAEAVNIAQWSAHVLAFAPEPELEAHWRCRHCKRRWPTYVTHCDCAGGGRR